MHIKRSSPLFKQSVLIKSASWMVRPVSDPVVLQDHTRVLVQFGDKALLKEQLEFCGLNLQEGFVSVSIGAS